MAQQAEFNKSIMKQMNKLTEKKKKKKKKKRSRQRYSDSDSSDSDWDAGSKCSDTSVCSSKDSVTKLPKLKRNKSNNTTIAPINAFNNSNINYNNCEKAIHSTSRRQVVKGRGNQSATAAIPQLRENAESPKQKKVWKVLFDSGSDGDIAFIYKRDKASIKMQNRLHPQRWKTSNVIFETHKVGIIKLTLPRFSTSKVMSVTPDIQFIEEPPPQFMI